MPTFYGAGTTVQLSAANLQRAASEDPLPNKCPQASRNVEAMADEFTRALLNGTLAEDDVIDETTGMRTRFLGKQHDMPFFMVRAGEGFFAEKGEGKRTIRPARVPRLSYSPEPDVEDNAHAQPETSSHSREAEGNIRACGMNLGSKSPLPLYDHAHSRIRHK